MYPLSWFIATRYTRAKRKNHFISFISLASMLGIALGVMALITVLSVMNGFDAEIRERILSMTPHGVLLNYQGKLQEYPNALASIKTNKDIIAASPYVEGQVMFNSRGRAYGGIIKGIEPNSIDNVFPITDKITNGSLDDLKENSIVLGEDLANNLGLTLGDKVTIIIPEAISSPLGVTPRLKRFTLVGTFKVGYLFDNSFAFLNLSSAQKLFHYSGDEVSGLQLKFSHYLQAPRIANDLNQTYTGKYYVVDWTRSNGNYFRAVKMEKTLMFVILTLIIAVAAFNLVASLVMLVNDKTADIAILRTIGMPAKTIRKIFILQGLLVGAIGTSIGTFFGILLAKNITAIIDFIQSTFSVQLLSSDVYFVSFLPSKLEFVDVWQVCLVAIALSLLATIYPAVKAAKIEPAEALRYE